MIAQCSDDGLKRTKNAEHLDDASAFDDCHIALNMIETVKMRGGHLPKASVISMRKKSAAQTCHKVGDNYQKTCKYKYRYKPLTKLG